VAGVPFSINDRRSKLSAGTLVERSAIGRYVEPAQHRSIDSNPSVELDIGQFVR
jgi:hypothetical protein